MKDLLVSICSGLIGVLLTIGYQHFLAPEQPIIVNIDGEEIKVTSSSYEELSAENETLKAENILLTDQNKNYLDELTKVNNQMSELQLKLIQDENESLEKHKKSIYYNGNKINDDDGVIIQNNEDIYIPLELISTITKDQIEFDNNANSIYIGNNPNNVLYLGEQIKPYKKYGNNIHQILLYPESGSIVIAGKNYFHGIADSYIYGGTLWFNLDGKFNIISGLYAKTDKARPGNGTIMFYDENDSLLCALDLDSDMLPKEFNVDVTNVLQLRIEMSGGFTALVDTTIQ